MEGNVILIANTVIGGLFFTAVGFAVAWARARERAIRAELARQRLPAVNDPRLDRLQHAVEAVAVEVERISEAQRFTTKLLADRAPVAGTPAAQPLAPPRVVTPH